MRNALHTSMEPLYKFLRFMFEDVFSKDGDFSLGLTKVSGVTRGVAA
jgi:hypothetical protein